MKLLDLTLPSPEENLALDEALIEEAESGRLDEDVLRLWEAECPAVIVGRSSHVGQEVETGFCREHGIPILRRCSGGAAVVIGPGCLMYSVMLSYKRFPELRLVDAAHRFVLEQVAAAMGRLNPQVELQGISDLTVGGRKFSGNSLRCKRDHLLYHGTLLCRFRLDLICQCLSTPPRQPDYRAGRAHDEFVTNLDCSAEAVRPALIEQWSAAIALDEWPRAKTRQLVAERYATREWNLRY
jgi:lipoate-protein ligase A